MGYSEKENIDKLLNEKTTFTKMGDLSFLEKTIVSDYLGKAKLFIFRQKMKTTLDVLVENKKGRFAS
ncbi:MAG: hypothetical protein JJV94_00975 [Sulfurospirillum sp.]|nr:hypothetical protein [Sulfurospirillum sp.]